MAFGVFFANQVSAASNTLNFQSKIVNVSDGTNVVTGTPACVVAGSGNDTCDFRVNIYSASSAGTLYFSETHSNVEIGQYNGIFNLAINSVCTTSSGSSDGNWTNSGSPCVSNGGVDFSSSNLWIEIAFAPGGAGSFTETFSRVQIKDVASARYAVNSTYLSGYAYSDFVRFTPGSAQTTSSSASLINLESTGSSSAPMAIINENGPGTPDLLRLQTASSTVFGVSNTGSLTMVGDLVNSSTGTVGLFNTNVTTLNIGGATTTLNLAGGVGSTGCTINASGDLACLGSGTFTSTLDAGFTTFNLINTTATTINFGGAATTLNIAGGSGSTGCTINSAGDVACSGDITATGGDLITTATTATLFNTGATVAVNIAGAAATTNLGGTTVNLAGGVGSTGCTIDSAGALTCTAGISASITADSLDYIDFEDTMDLDAALVLNQGTNIWTQNFTGTTTVGQTYNANSLTSGTGLAIASTATALTGNLQTIALTSSSASNTGDLLELSVAATNAARGLYINNLGTGDSLRIDDVASDTTPFLIDASGNVSVGFQLRVPTTGSSAGVLIGGDAQLYRSAADTLSTGTGDSLLVDGIFGVGHTPTVAKASVNSDTTTTGIWHAFQSAGRNIGANANQVYGVSSTMTVDPGTGNTAATTYGLYSHVSLSSLAGNGVGNATNFYGGYFSSEVSSTGTVANNHGISIRNPNNVAGGSITTNYGLHISNQTSGVSDYGIYITGADTYAIWSDAGENRFDGDLVTGSTSLDIFNTTATSINFAGGATTALNIGPGGATAATVNIAGGSGATGCTVAGATGNLTCSGTISGTFSMAADSLDYIDFQDTLDLDNHLTYNQSSFIITQNFTGSTTVGTTYNVNSLTSGTGFAVISSATGLTTGGSVATIGLTGSNAANIGDVLEIFQTGTSSGAKVINMSNYGSGDSIRIDDVSGDTTPFIIDASGNVSVGGNINTSLTSIDVVNTTATTVNFAGAATTLALAGGSGSTGCTINSSGDITCTGDVTATGGDLITTATTAALFNTGATTAVNIAGAAATTNLGGTTINLAGGSGSTGCTIDSSGNITCTGDVTATGGDLITTSTTSALFNTGATTLSIGGAATTFNIGPAGATATTLLFAGGSGATGCSMTGNDGAFTCTSTITGGGFSTAGNISGGGITGTTLTGNNSITTGGTLTGSGVNNFGSGSTDYTPTTLNWNTIGGSTIVLNALNYSALAFHDSGSRVDFIRTGAGTMTLGYDGGWGNAAIAMPGVVSIGNSTLTETLNVGMTYPGAQAFVASFFHDGNNANADGILIQGGQDDGLSTTIYLQARDGDGTNVGRLANVAGTFALADQSDRRTKTNIVDTTIQGLSTLNALRVVDYNRIQAPNGPTIHGFIAQEVQTVYPFAVFDEDDQGMLSLSKELMIPMIVKATQELSDRVDLNTGSVGDLRIRDTELLALINGLTTRVAGLETRVATLEGAQSGSGAAVDLVNFMATNGSFSGNLTVAGNTNINGKVYFGNENVGEAKILAGDTEVTIVFDTAFETMPIVQVTPQSDNFLTLPVKYVVSEKAVNKFKIKIDVAQLEDLVFNWSVSGTRDGVQIDSDGNVANL